MIIICGTFFTNPTLGGVESKSDGYGAVVTACLPESLTNFHVEIVFAFFLEMDLHVSLNIKQALALISLN